uniref:Uncharacterized protein n=1 Tax=Ascaris lumbricoides TaxID=6252 RepID=A0A0M3IQM2_ASCLU
MLLFSLRLLFLLSEYCLRSIRRIEICLLSNLRR